MWISGTQKPDLRTISDFRQNNIKVLKEVVQASSADLSQVKDGKPAIGSYRRDKGEGNR